LTSFSRYENCGEGFKERLHNSAAQISAN
jgi:hypothetical protein